MENKRPGQGQSLAGMNLYVDDRGYYIWRRVDKTTGKRIKRSTGTTRLDHALRKAATFDDEHARREAGLPDFSSWRKELAPLAEQYLASIDGDLSERMKKQKPSALKRALKDLGLTVAADLDHVARLHDRLLSLEQPKGPHSRATLRRYYQDELRQFSRWLADHKRHLDRDPLACWQPLKFKKRSGRAKRRALLPDEVARALQASDRLDEIHGRAHPQRAFFVSALVTGARPGALASRDVVHCDVRGRRILLGEDVGKKRRGVAGLDPTTLAELVLYIGERKEGVLFLSPDGKRLDERVRLVDRWRECFGLGVVAALWPATEPHDLELAYVVNRALLTGRASANKGGNPKLIRPDTLARRGEVERRATAVAEAIGGEWRRLMEGVDLYSLRKTHRTWAEHKRVPGLAVDKQLGHASSTASDATEFARLIAGSQTGRTHYLDMESELFDPWVSAKAVRELLDSAVAALASEVSVLSKKTTDPSGSELVRDEKEAPIIKLPVAGEEPGVKQTLG